MMKRIFSVAALAAFTTAAACGERADDPYVDDTTVQPAPTTETAPVTTPPATYDDTLLVDTPMDGTDPAMPPATETDTETM